MKDGDGIPKGYKLTEVGVIPEDWEVKPLGSILSKGRLGGNYPNRNDESDYPLIKMGNVARGYFAVVKVEFITAPDYSRISADSPLLA